MSEKVLSQLQEIKKCTDRYGLHLITISPLRFWLLHVRPSSYPKVHVLYSWQTSCYVDVATLSHSPISYTPRILSRCDLAVHLIVRPSSVSGVNDTNIWKGECLYCTSCTSDLHVLLARKPFESDAGFHWAPKDANLHDQTLKSMSLILCSSLCSMGLSPTVVYIKKL